MFYAFVATFFCVYIGSRIFDHFYVNRLVIAFTSGSVPKIISASITVRNMYSSRRLYEISKYLNEIESRTKYIEWGADESGGYQDRNYAIEKLKYIKFNRSGCLCKTYPYDYKFNLEHQLRFRRIKELKKEIKVGIRHFKLIQCTKCQEIYRCEIGTS